jgi:hypothetical protein
MEKPILTCPRVLAVLTLTTNLLNWYVSIRPSPIAALMVVVLTFAIAWLEVRRKD